MCCRPRNATKGMWSLVASESSGSTGRNNLAKRLLIVDDLAIPRLRIPEVACESGWEVAGGSKVPWE